MPLPPQSPFPELNPVPMPGGKQLPASSPILDRGFDNPPPAPSVMPVGPAPASMPATAGLEQGIQDANVRALLDRSRVAEEEASSSLPPPLPSSVPMELSPEMLRLYKLGGPEVIQQGEGAIQKAGVAKQDQVRLDSELSANIAAQQDATQKQVASAQGVRQIQRDKSAKQIAAIIDRGEGLRDQLYRTTMEPYRAMAKPEGLLAAIGTVFMTAGGKAELGQKMLDDFIQRDVNAQMEDFSRKKTAVSENDKLTQLYYQQFGNQEDVHKMKLADAYETAALQMSRMKSSNMSAKQLASIDAIGAEYQGLSAQFRMEVAHKTWEDMKATTPAVAAERAKTGAPVLGAGGTPVGAPIPVGQAGKLAASDVAQRAIANIRGVPMGADTSGGTVAQPGKTFSAPAPAAKGSVVAKVAGPAPNVSDLEKRLRLLSPAAQRMVILDDKGEPLSDPKLIEARHRVLANQMNKASKGGGEAYRNPELARAEFQKEIDRQKAESKEVIKELSAQHPNYRALNANIMRAQAKRDQLYAKFGGTEKGKKLLQEYMGIPNVLMGGGLSKASSALKEGLQQAGYGGDREQALRQDILDLRNDALMNQDLMSKTLTGKSANVTEGDNYARLFGTDVGWDSYSRGLDRMAGFVNAINDDALAKAARSGYWAEALVRDDILRGTAPSGRVDRKPVKAAP